MPGVSFMRFRSEVLKLVEDRSAAREIEGNFLCFLMIPVITRFGQWRFAGAAYNLDEAFFRIETLMTAFTKSGEWNTMLSLAEVEVLEWPEPGAAWSGGELDDRGLGSFAFEILAEGGSPHDDCGFAVLSLPTLQGHPYATRGVESRWPEAWTGGDYEADLDRACDEWIPAN
jgi:hypothetical protein